MFTPHRLLRVKEEPSSSSHLSSFISLKCSSAGGGGRNTFDNLPPDVLLRIFSHLDGVSVCRCSRVCSSFRVVIVGEMSRQECRVQPSKGFARVFVRDRRRVILERFNDDEDGCEYVSGCGASLSSSPSSSHAPERSNSHSTVRSVSSTHSMQDFIQALHNEKRRKKTLRERLEPRGCKVEETRQASNADPAWAYKFDIEDWKENYEIIEVCLQNLARFLDNATNPMAEPCGPVGGGTPIGIASTSTPPSVMRPMGEPLSQTVVNKITEEMETEMRLLSAGRLERLADKLSDINPLHLVFKDHVLSTKRPTTLIFYLISLLRTHLRRVTFHEVQGMDAVRLEGALPMEYIEHLTINIAPHNSGIIVNEEILLSWLALPSHKRAKLRARFQGCRRLSPRGMCRFIRTWQTYPDVAEFECIIVDDDSMHTWEFIAEAEKEEKSYDQDEGYVRPIRRDIPAYLSSEKDTRSAEQLESVRRTMEFRHKKAQKAIKYYYEDGLLIFACVDVQSRTRSPPSPSVSFLSTSRSLSSSNRPLSLTRPSVNNVLPPSAAAPLHSFHPPPASPGMFDRIFQILRSNA